MNRYCNRYILKDLEKKMVFIGGPRQVGKTTIAKAFCRLDYLNGEYYNWDAQEDRYTILHKEWNPESPLVVFDELHKFPKWKQWIKGVYDTKPPLQQYLVTGSARLDTYRRGGDSLMGRYHYWRLHPLSLDELPTGISAVDAYTRLLEIGGFPEPFLTNDLREARRWRKERFDRVLREDVRDLEQIRNIQLLQLFVDSLRSRVSSNITISNIAYDLEISPKTAKLWLSLIEKMYIAFAIYPMTQKIQRAILKPPKVYFYDNADVIGNNGTRLENLVATHLLKRMQFIEDYEGRLCQLKYIRDKDGREVDFVTIIDNEIIDLIEVKHSDKDISTSLKYYTNKLKPKRSIQIVGNLKRPFFKDGIEVLHPIDYFENPPWA